MAICQKIIKHFVKFKQYKQNHLTQPSLRHFYIKLCSFLRQSEYTLGLKSFWRSSLNPQKNLYSKAYRYRGSSISTVSVVRIPQKTCVAKVIGCSVFWIAWFLEPLYCKIASSNTFRLEAHVVLFRLLMKGIFGPYVLWTFDKKLIFWLVTRIRTCNIWYIPKNSYCTCDIISPGLYIFLPHFSLPF